MSSQQGQRRFDRVTDPGYLVGVEDAPAAQVRAMRDECRQEEARLSYARRVLHGQIDIARAEADRRGTDSAKDLVASLADVLADAQVGPAREPRAVGMYDPEAQPGRRREDGLLDEPAISRMPDLSEAELAELAGRLTSQEAEISEQRRVVLSHLDRLQDELVRRYRDGRADIDEVVSASPGEEP